MNPNGHPLNSFRKYAEISDWSLEGARLQAAPYNVFKGLTTRLGSRALSKLRRREFFFKLLSDTQTAAKSPAPSNSKVCPAEGPSLGIGGK